MEVLDDRKGGHSFSTYARRGEGLEQTLRPCIQGGREGG